MLVAHFSFLCILAFVVGDIAIMRAVSIQAALLTCFFSLNSFASPEFTLLEDQSTLDAMTKANSTPPPAHGIAHYRYTKNVHPRYDRADDYESYLEAQLAAVRKENPDVASEDLKVRLEAEAVNQALRVMNDSTEVSSYEVRFSGSKMLVKSQLIEMTSRLEIPRSLASNPDIRQDDKNKTQIVSYDGATYLRQSQIGNLGMLATFQRGSDPLLQQFPLIHSNAPPFSELGNRIKSITSKEYEGRNSLCVELRISQTEDYPVIYCYFDAASYRLLATESYHKQGDEIGKSVERFSVERVSPGGLPKRIEFATLFASSGRPERLVEQQIWELESFSDRKPLDSEFVPKLDADVVEVAYLEGTQEKFRAVDPDRKKPFTDLLAAIQNNGIESTSALEAYQNWTGNRNGSSGMVRLFTVPRIAVLCSVFVLMCVIAIFMRRKQV